MSASISACVFVLLLNSLTKCELLLWGHDNLENIAPSSLSVFNDDYLNLIIDNTRPKRVVVFIDDGNERIANQNLPKFKQLVEEYKSVYILHNSALMSLRDLPTVTLDGTDTQKDEKITTKYQELESRYGHGKVLGVLLNINHRIRRRDITESKDCLYNAPGKAVLYTSSYPTLRLNRENDSISEFVLKKYTSVTGDVREQQTRLVVTFVLEDASKVVLKFRFLNRRGYWAFSVVEVIHPNLGVWILSAANEMGAPKGFSYHCSGLIIFKNGTSSLTLTDIQLQPAPVKETKFSDAYDCVNFMTVPIWSGLFVTAILAVGLIVGLTAIAEIRTMDRFDDPKGKGLSIFVPEQ